MVLLGEDLPSGEVGSQRRPGWEGCPAASPGQSSGKAFPLRVSFSNGESLFLYPSHSPGVFSDPHHEIQVEFLEEKPKNMWGSLKTAITRNLLFPL